MTDRIICARAAKLRWYQGRHARRMSEGEVLIIKGKVGVVRRVVKQALAPPGLDKFDLLLEAEDFFGRVIRPAAGGFMVD